MEHQMEERLWHFIDGTISADEKTVITQLLEKDAEWKSKYNELLEINQLLRSSDLEQPSLRFAKNVMEGIAQLHVTPAAKTYINKRIIWGIGLFFLTLIVGFLAYGFSQIQWNVAEDNGLLKQVNRIDFSRMFNNTWINVFMMINVILGLFLLDNYLRSKRRKFARYYQ